MLWRELQLDQFWSKRLGSSRKGTHWDQVLFVPQRQRRPIGQERLREELPHHVTGQLARRAAQGLRRLLLLGFRIG
jgi:hypothetical protein